MVVVRPAVTVVARVKDSVVTSEGYPGNGGGGDEDNSKANSGKNGEHSGRGGASHLCLIYFLSGSGLGHKVCFFSQYITVT